MTREIRINISLTPREIEKGIWDLDATQQADLVLAIAQRYKNEGGKVCFQLENMKDEVQELLTREEIRWARVAFGQIFEYLKGAELSAIHKHRGALANLTGTESEE